MVVKNVDLNADYDYNSYVYCGSSFFDSAMYFFSDLDAVFKIPDIEDVYSGIDNVKYIGNGVFMTKEFGPIDYTKLSGGTKTLLTMILKRDYPDLLSFIPDVYSSAAWGDNCLPYLARISHTCHGEIWMLAPCQWYKYKDLEYDFQDVHGNPLTNWKQLALINANMVGNHYDS